MAHWLETALLNRQLVSPAQLLTIQHDRFLGPARLGERLYRCAAIDAETLLSLFLEAGAEDATAQLSGPLPPPSALGALERELAVEHRVIPLALEDNRLKLGMLDPSDAAAIEAAGYFAGLLVDPFVVRADVLFATLHKAYGAPLVVPDGSLIPAPPRIVRDGDHHDDETLPPPSATLPEVNVAAPHAADPLTSPLAAQLMSAAGETPDFLMPPRGEAPAFGWLREHGPSSPPLSDDRETTAEVRSAPLQLRDSIPPQVLPILVPPFRAAMLFLVRDKVAVGWDGAGLNIGRDDIRDVLLPLTGPSCFARAWAWGMVAAGSPRAPTTIERIFFRFLRANPPSAFVVVPVKVGEEVVCLLYVDKKSGNLDDQMLKAATQTGAAIADALAPLLREGVLFGPLGDNETGHLG